MCLKNNDDYKFFVYIINFLSQTKTLLLNMLKLFKIPGIARLFSDFCLKFKFFVKISQIPVFFGLNCKILSISKILGFVKALLLNIQPH